MKIVLWLAAAMLACAAPAAAQPGDADLLREVRDRAQIEELMWTYVRAIDSFDADAYARVFTPDGAFGQTRGGAALRKMVVDLKRSQDDRRAKGENISAMHHIMTNQHIAFTGRDSARVRYYWMTVFGGAANLDPSLAVRVAAVGRGVDDVVRVDGKWLISNRNVLPKD